MNPPDHGALERLDAAGWRRVVVVYRDALRAHQQELNQLNVYPVPDGDTGTNMALTLESVCAELGAGDAPDDDTVDPDAMAEVCRAVAHGSLMGARGNSGVILSQILRGLAQTFAGVETIGPGEVATGLRTAATAAYQAVMRPVEGTILTVVTAAADAAETAGDDAGLVEMLEAVEVEAHDAVERTPELLPVLAQAGVVDAGGRGLELLVDAFLHVVDGRPIPEPAVVATPRAIEEAMHGTEGGGLRYEVMFLLEADDATVPAFKQTWDALGDSIVVVGGDGIWNCHVHTNDVGGAVEAGIEAGRPRKIQVTDLVDQVGAREEGWVAQHTGAHTAGADDRFDDADTDRAVATSVVAVGTGTGVRRLLGSLGVHRVVAGGQSMNPSTAQILEAVDACPGAGVIVLPNNKNIIPVAEQVDGLTDRPVAVVPTRTVLEGLAALVAYDPETDPERNVAAMADAAGRVRTGEITQAVRDGRGACGPIAAGDWLAVTRDGIRCAERSAPAAALALVEELIDADTELVTVLVGAGVSHRERAALVDRITDAHPGVELEVHEGDQPLYPFLVAVE